MPPTLAPPHPGKDMGKRLKGSVEGEYERIRRKRKGM